MLSRFWRLAPVFIAINAITIPLLFAVGIPPPVVLTAPISLTASSIFILGYAKLPYLPVGSGWSLDIEMQFYIFAPLIALTLRYVGLIPVILTTTALSLLAATYLMGPALPQFSVFFVIGMASSAIAWRPKRWQMLFSGLGTTLILLITLATPLRGLVLAGSHVGPLFVWNEQYNVILAVLTIPFAIYTTHQQSDELDRVMADLSYVVYLLHWVAIQWLFTIVGSHFYRLCHVVIAWALVLPASWLIWRYLDRPINIARSRWVTLRTQTSTQMAVREAPGP